MIKTAIFVSKRLFCGKLCFLKKFYVVHFWSLGGKKIFSQFCHGVVEIEIYLPRGTFLGEKFEKIFSFHFFQALSNKFQLFYENFPAGLSDFFLHVQMNILVSQEFSQNANRFADVGVKRELNWQVSAEKTDHLKGLFCFHVMNMAQNSDVIGKLLFLAN